jgi:hydroxyacylglutathione hydrolase
LAREVRARGEPTVGATLAEELATNPFLRCKDAAELARLRRAKDEFRAP